MTSRIFIAVLSAAALAACSTEQPPVTETAAPAPEAAAQLAPAAGTSTAAADPAKGEQSPRRLRFGPNPRAADLDNAIGVPECDSFLARYESCLTKRMPAESRGPMQTALESWRGTWKTLASSPTTKGTLPQTCKAAADSARTQFTAQGCTF
jgi:hypothetical protein